ncbi:MAG: peptidyl-prolyl cis-trans isomerase SurA [Rhodobacteraceae bacterium HLUCCA12]|nr:MAG: peptidyl-prolyl cis-trans isomerase SurA [Rhodobacteraceae bacterium HLUCCA12]
MLPNPDRPAVRMIRHRPQRPGTRRWAVTALAILGLATGAALAQPAAAQSPFSAAFYVNEQAVTNYEIDQYARFLEFLGVGASDPNAEARERLIEDRIRLQEARRLGVRVSEEDVMDGMSEFASRAELSRDEMIERLAEQGIERDTFETFVRAGVLWRELVNQRHGPGVRVTDAEIEQALAVESVRPVTEVMLSEIFLPADPQYEEAVEELIPQIEAITSMEEFANAARQVSAAPTAPQGGRIDRWIELETLPEPVAAAAADVAPGTIIGPVEVPGAYAFFMLRDRRNTRDVPAGDVEVEYRRLDLPGGRSEQNLERLAEIESLVDDCDGLGRVVGRVAPDLPEGAVSTHSRRQTELPTGIATELGRLNPGQLSANMTEDGDMVVLMLCHRNVVPDPAPSESQIEESLFNRKLEGISEVYMQSLRAEAEIRAP